MPGGWVRPRKKDVLRVIKKVGSSRICAQKLGMKKQFFYWHTLTYADWHLLCLMAGEKTPDLRFCGSTYQNAAYGQELESKFRATKEEIKGVKLDTSNLDMCGLSRTEAREQIPELDIETIAQLVGKISG
jgi:hypothetical protein